MHYIYGQCTANTARVTYRYPTEAFYRHADDHAPCEHDDMKGLTMTDPYRLNWPEFRYDKLTAHSHRVVDAHTGEAYGTVHAHSVACVHGWTDGYGIHGMQRFATREDAARALYAARYAHGFEAGAL